MHIAQENLVVSAARATLLLRHLYTEYGHAMDVQRWEKFAVACWLMGD